MQNSWKNLSNCLSWVNFHNINGFPSHAHINVIWVLFSRKMQKWYHAKITTLAVTDLNNLLFWPQSIIVFSCMPVPISYLDGKNHLDNTYLLTSNQGSKLTFYFKMTPNESFTIKALRYRGRMEFLISASQALNSIYLTLKTDWKTNSIVDNQTDALPKIFKTV